MMKHILIFLYSIWLLSCGNQAKNHPKRPSNVDTSAVWVGGLDGGYWIKIDSVISNGEFEAKIYNGYTGEIDVASRFCSNSPKLNLLEMGKEKIYSNFDYITEEEIGLKVNNKVIVFRIIDEH